MPQLTPGGKHLGRVRPYEIGRPLPHHDEARLQFHNYAASLGLVLEAPPRVLRRLAGTGPAAIAPGGWGMCLNDKLGCCVVAEEDHNILATTALVTLGMKVYVPDATTAEVYHLLSPNDEGLNIGRWLDYYKATGYAGYRGLGHVAVNPADLPSVKAAIDYFGGVKVGVNLPGSAERQFDAGRPWTLSHTWFDRCLGGHCVGIYEYDEQWLYGVTWGQEVPISPAWFRRYAEEVWARVSTSWFDSAGFAPSDLDRDHAVAALEHIAA